MVQSTLESLLVRARQHLESGSWDDALETAEEAIGLSQGNIKAWRYKGFALLKLERFEDASEAFTKVTQLQPDDLYGWRRLSNAYEELKDYEKAIETCRQAIKACGGDPYLYHEMGNLYWKQGDYRSAWQQWEVALKEYREGSSGDKPKQDADYFYSFGRLLQDFGSLHEAEKCFEQGLKIETNHVGILKAVTNLYIEWGSEAGDDQLQINYHWKARRRYREAVKTLSERLKTRENADDYIRLGELHLAVGNDKEGHQSLERAVELEPENPFALVGLGVICTRMMEPNYEKAAECFRRATNIDPFDLKTQSNLAEVYQTMGLIEAAEQQYQRVLRVAPEQVESHIGLAEVYAALGDDGEADAYEEALVHFGKALTLGQPGRGSKRLAKKERAAVLYSRGYVWVKAYEARKPRREHLSRAYDDFRECVKLDQDHHAARRARDRVRQEFTSTDQWLPDRVGPLLVSAMALLVFVFVQLAFFVGWPTVDIGRNQYVLLTLGLLVFVIAGLYLPRILKLKVAGIELEKSVVEQIAPRESLGIPPPTIWRSYSVSRTG